MKVASAKLEDVRVSLQHISALCKEIKGKRLEKAKKLLEDLVEKKLSLKGKYYTKASKKLLEILESAEANAKNKGLDSEKLFVRNVKANKGEAFIRPRSRFKLRGRRAKSVNIEILLEER